MDTTEQRKPFHVMVAEKLIEQLEQGTAPWQKPWEPGADLPLNPVSGKRYRGINALHLMSEGRSDPRWLTYRQAQAMDAQVRSGEKGTTIQYWKFAEERPIERDGKPVLDGQGEPVKQTINLERPRVFFATVFNAEQIDGLPPLAARTEHTWNPIDRAERILQASGAVMRHDERDAAYYRPLTDSIHMPRKDQFPDAAAYYAVSLHELGHWTGHGKRLDRDLAHPFGSEGYAREELRAEIASMMLGSEIGIGHDPQRHTAYVGSWIKALRDDPLEIFRAAADAEQMCAYLLGLEQKQLQDIPPEQASLTAEAAHPQAIVEADGTSGDRQSSAVVPEDWHGVDQERDRNRTGLNAAPLQEPGNLDESGDKVTPSQKDNKPDARRTALETAASSSAERQRRSEAWTLSQLVEGTLERALDKGTPGQLNQVEQALTAMYPLDPTNPFWERHQFPQDVPRVHEQIIQAQAAVTVRQLDARVSASRLALVTGQAFGPGRATDAAAFEGEAKNVLGFTLPHDWTGDVRIEASVTTNVDGKRAVVPSEATGRAPEAWGVYARRGDGNHQWLTDHATEQEAERLAERLARIDAHSTLNEYEKTAKFARIHEARVRRSPDSTDEDIVAAKEARKNAEANMTLHDADLQRRIEQAERERGREGVGHSVPGSAKTLIAVPYKEKDEAKALGAKWDRQQQSWYVPADMDPAPFSKWQKSDAPATGNVAPVSATRTETEDGRIYLAVPYSERVEAKAAGALWDKTAGSWYAGPQGDMTALAKWHPENVAAQQDPSMSPREEFAGFLTSLGCVISGEHPIMDGRSHRISVEGEKYSANAGSGFYVGHLDGHPAGYAKNNKTGHEENWKAKGYKLDNEDKVRLAAEAAAKLREREAELVRRQEQAAQRVATQLAELVTADHPTPYMVAKGLGPQPGTFTDKDGKKTCLPAIDADGKQWTMQYVQENGTKLFAKDSRKEGCFHVVGHGLDELAKAPVIVIAEGYATAATLRQTLGYATVSAFDAGNLAPVAQALHRKYPDKPVIIACDDDRHLELTQGVNPGRNKGQEAARLVGGTALLPIFAPGENAYPAGLDAVTPKLFREHQRTDGVLSEAQLAALDRMKQFTDFNDLANRSALGLDGVERQIRAAVNLAVATDAHVKQQEIQQHVRQPAQGSVLEQKPKRRRKAATIA
jgi:putative DNA primase/helicase